LKEVMCRDSFNVPWARRTKAEPQSGATAVADEEETPRPSAADAACRLLLLHHGIVYALTAPPRYLLEEAMPKWSDADRRKFAEDAVAQRDEFWGELRRSPLWDSASPVERELAESTFVDMTAQQQVNASWRIESAQALMWALGMIPELPAYDVMASQDLLQFAADVGPDFLMKSRLRDAAEIESARSLAELWHWRSRTRQLSEEGAIFPSAEKMKEAGFGGFDEIVRVTARRVAEEGRIPACIDDDFPVFGKAYRDLSAEEWATTRSITVERHFALNWLSGFAPGNAWDETPTDT
jgi:hypothetical protein